MQLYQLLVLLGYAYAQVTQVVRSFNPAVSVGNPLGIAYDSLQQSVYVLYQATGNNPGTSPVLVKFDLQGNQLASLQLSQMSTGAYQKIMFSNNHVLIAWQGTTAGFVHVYDNTINFKCTLPYNPPFMSMVLVQSGGNYRLILTATSFAPSPVAPPSNQLKVFTATDMVSMGTSPSLCTYTISGNSTFGSFSYFDYDQSSDVLVYSFNPITTGAATRLVKINNYLGGGCAYSGSAMNTFGSARNFKGVRFVNPGKFYAYDTGNWIYRLDVSSSTAIEVGGSQNNGLAQTPAINNVDDMEPTDQSSVQGVIVTYGNQVAFSNLISGTGSCLSSSRCTQRVVTVANIGVTVQSIAYVSQGVFVAITNNNLVRLVAGASLTVSVQTTSTFTAGAVVTGFIQPDSVISVSLSQKPEVFISGAQASVESFSASQITFKVPNVFGAGNSVLITYANLPNTAMSSSQFTIDTVPLTLENVESPTQMLAAGGQYVLVKLGSRIVNGSTYGMSFFEQYQKDVGQPVAYRNCSTVTFLSSTQLQCLSSPSFNHPFYGFVKVQVNGYESDQIQFAMARPTVDYTVFSDLDIDGGQLLNITGSNFGVCSFNCWNQFKVTIGSSWQSTGNNLPKYTCSNLAIVSNTLMRCQLQSGTGSLDMFVEFFQNDGLTAINPQPATHPLVSYRIPTISSVVPNPAPANDSYIYISGDSFKFSSDSQPYQSNLKLIMIPVKANSYLQRQQQSYFNIQNDVEVLTKTMLRFKPRFTGNSQSYTVPFGNYSLQLGSFQQVQQGASLFVPYGTGVNLELYAVPLILSDNQNDAIPLVQGTSFQIRAVEITSNVSPAETFKLYLTVYPSHGKVYKDNILMNPSDYKNDDLTNTGTIMYVPDKYYYGLDQIEFRILNVESKMLSGLNGGLFNISAKNQAPYVDSQTQISTIPEDVKSNVTLKFNDFDDSSWVFKVTQLPQLGTLHDPYTGQDITTLPYFVNNGTRMSNCTLQFTPEYLKTGIDYARFSWNALDAAGQQVTTDITTQFNVYFVNHPPIIQQLSFQGPEHQDLAIKLEATDVDVLNQGQKLTFKIISLPLNGTLYQADSDGSKTVLPVLRNNVVSDPKGQLVYQPFADKYFHGFDYFNYSVTDNDALVTGTVQLNLTFVDSPPEILLDLIEELELSNEQQTTALEVLYDDPDDTELTLIVSKIPARGQWYLDNVKTPLQLNHLVGVDDVPKLMVEHDGLGGAYPYAQLALYVNDSYGLSSGKVQVTVLVKCPIGKYNNIWSSGDVCVDCPNGALCSAQGLFYPQNLAGYFPLSNSTFLACSPADACPAYSQRIDTSKFTCNSGYTGERCGQCSQQFYRNGQLCQACPNYNVPVAVLCLIFIAVLSVLLYLVNLLRKVDLGFIGILVTYVQTIAIFKSFNLQWPNVVLGLFKIFSILNLNIELASPECFVVSPEKSYEAKFYMTLGIPVVLLLVVTFLLSLNALAIKVSNGLDISQLIDRMAGKNTKKELKMKSEGPDVGQNPTFATTLVSVYLLALQLLYLTLSQKTISLFDCIHDPQTDSFFFNTEPSKHCYIEAWWQELMPYSVLGIIFYIVGIPGCFAGLWYLRARYLKIDSSARTWFQQFVLKVGYKSKPTYLPQYEYWDSVIMVRKLGIVFSNLFFAQFKAFQALLLIVILVVGLLAQRLNPYSIPSLNLLETATLFSSILVLIIGVMAYVGNFSDAQGQVFGIVIVLIISGCTAMILYNLLKHFHFLYTKFQAAKNAIQKTSRDFIASFGQLPAGTTTVLLDQSEHPDQGYTAQSFYSPPRSDAGSPDHLLQSSPQPQSPDRLLSTPPGPDRLMASLDDEEDQQSE